VYEDEISRIKKATETLKKSLDEIHQKLMLFKLNFFKNEEENQPIDFMLDLR
jgi:DNA-directed RNA polymerase alpha subunit